MPIEIQVLTGLQALAMMSPWSVALVVFCARWFIFANIIPAVFLLCGRSERAKHAVLEAVWSAGCALAITAIIAFVIQRERPFLSSLEIELLIPPPLTTAFPSGHTSTAVAIACAFLSVSRVAGGASVAIAGIVAMGRMAAGVHFPTDIFGGMCVGVLAFAIVRFTHLALRSKDIVRAAAKYYHT